jgi:SAM-dependent methyltransferase
MSLDIVDLRNFYASPLGSVTRNLLLAAIRERWPNLSGLVVMGLGYATPYLSDYRQEAVRSLAFMPAAQGVVNWPSTGLSSSALVDADQLPLRDGSVDRVIIVHALETSYDPAAVLSELWRVLSPGGRLIAIVPNRGGLWARLDGTPFGFGQPFSRSQVTSLMRQALFTPVNWQEALYLPPMQGRLLLRTGRVWDRAARALALPFAGVHVVEATKQVIRPALVRRGARVFLEAEPTLVPSRAINVIQSPAFQHARDQRDQ